MSLRTVTPAAGQAQLVINWDGGSSTVTAGQVVDIPAGGALESAYGLTNLNTADPLARSTSSLGGVGRRAGPGRRGTPRARA